jgi:hypothetical protein
VMLIVAVLGEGEIVVVGTNYSSRSFESCERTSSMILSVICCSFSIKKLFDWA